MIKKLRPVKTNCIFCKKDEELSYKNIEQLEKYLTDRGKIISRARTGVCQKHQRRLTKAVKRARHLALLPFISKA